MELDLLPTHSRRSSPLKPSFTNREEDLAAHYLRLLGFTVLSRNDRRFGAELDFLCARGASDEVFIFEVKKARRAGDGYPKISALQLRRLKHAAEKMQVSADKFITVRMVILLVDHVTRKVEMVADVNC